MRQKFDVFKRRKIRTQFRRFRGLCPDLPLGKPHFFDGTKYDPPDVCIGSGTLGIEFRDFFHGEASQGGSAQKASEIFFDEVVEKAEEQFKQQNQDILGVHPLWSNNTRPKDSEQPKFVRALLDLVTRSIPKYQHELVELTPDKFADTCLKDYLISIGISKLPPEAYSTWANNRSGKVDVGIKDIEVLVKEKEKRLSRCREKAKLVWLVIFASGQPASSYVHLDSTVTPACIKSDFDRVYFFNETYNDNQLMCLK